MSKPVLSFADFSADWSRGTKLISIKNSCTTERSSNDLLSIFPQWSHLTSAYNQFSFQNTISKLKEVVDPVTE